MGVGLKVLISVLLNFVSFFAMASNQGFALRTSENQDGFARCAVEAALGVTEVFTLNKLLYSKISEASGPSLFAYLFFNAKTKSGAETVFRLAFKTESSSGWSLVQGENGEIFPFATQVEPKALLLDTKNGFVLGARDISTCLK